MVPDSICQALSTRIVLDHASVAVSIDPNVELPHQSDVPKSQLIWKAYPPRRHQSIFEQPSGRKGGTVPSHFDQEDIVPVKLADGFSVDALVGCQQRDVATLPGDALGSNIDSAG